MSDAQITQQLASQGYSNVKITDHDKNHVDVTASKDGKTQKLAVDPRTGRAATDTDDDSTSRPSGLAPLISFASA